MPDGPVAERFEERRSEIRAYLDFLGSVEAAVGAGTPRIGPEGPDITAQQQKILYSAVYLQLYNLVEATVTGCLDAVTLVALKARPRSVGDLSDEMRTEWVRHMARTHQDMSPPKRLEAALGLCEHLVAALPAAPFSISWAGGGNWDDEQIHRISTRLGFDLALSVEAAAAVKEKLRDDRGAMGLVVDLRNGLAHGRLSFVECGQGVTVSDLATLSDRIFLYLREVVAAFERCVGSEHYLRPAARAQGAV